MKKIFIFVLLCFSMVAASAQDGDLSQAEQDAVIMEMEAAAEKAAAQAEEAASRKKTGKNTVVDFLSSGETRHLEPYSGFSLGLAFTRLNIMGATDFPIGVPDILSAGDVPGIKENGRLIVDFKKIYSKDSVKKDGVDFNFGFGANDFLRLEFSSMAGGLGVSILSFTSRFDFNLTADVFKMLAEGLTEGVAKYGANVSGAIFAETVAVNWHRQNFLFPKLFFSVTPSHFLPIIYIPHSDLNIKFTNKDYIELGLEGTAKVYMPFNVFKYMDGEDPGAMDLGGLDFSLQLEYALFAALDVGFTALNVPLVPAVLHTSSSLKFDPSRNTILSVRNLIDQDLEIKTDSITDWERVDGTGENIVVRPMRMDFYALLRPFQTDFLVVRPNIGFTVLNPSETGYFNMGVEAQLNLGRWFTASFFTGGYDGFFHNKLGLDLRILKISRLYTNISMSSQDYGGAWTLKGLNVEIGAKWGGGFNGLTNF
ncbi:MAG: hypothetical protein LBC53_06270 [Spirochaetaceae bacterium]|nr:hypothetical protein [Spirochaetaceae bacterium]